MKVVQKIYVLQSKHLYIIQRKSKNLGGAE
jgi:hypothetical protein